MIGLGGSNVFAALKELTRERGPVLATVSTVHNDGTATVAVRGGGTQRVKTSWALDSGDNVLIKNGKVDSTAPVLSSHSIDI